MFFAPLHLTICFQASQQVHVTGSHSTLSLLARACGDASQKLQEGGKQGRDDHEAGYFLSAVPADCGV